MDKEKPSMELKIPANMEYTLIARMALSGFGMLAGLEVGLIDDLRTVTDECFDCLLHQGLLLTKICIAAEVSEGILQCKFSAERTDERALETTQDYEITRCILETLLPNVRLLSDENGVYCIDFSMCL